MLEKFKKNNYGHCLWEIMMTVILDKDEVRAQIIDGILLVLSMPVAKLYGLS